MKVRACRCSQCSHGAEDRGIKLGTTDLEYYSLFQGAGGLFGKLVSLFIPFVLNRGADESSENKVRYR